YTTLFRSIAALQDANGAPCKIHTDSEFWINVITKWSLGWEKNGWKKKNGEIKNLDLVQEVCPLYRSSNAQLIWVRGHNNDDGNEMAESGQMRLVGSFLLGNYNERYICTSKARCDQV